VYIASMHAAPVCVMILKTTDNYGQVLYDPRRDMEVDDWGIPFHEDQQYAATRENCFRQEYGHDMNRLYSPANHDDGFPCE